MTTLSPLNFRKNKKGIGTIFGTVFFILIVVIVLASFVTILEQNSNLERTFMQTRQMDLDRAREQLIVSYDSVTGSCTIKNNGAMVVQVVRLWTEGQDNSWSNIAVSIVLQPGETYPPTTGETTPLPPGLKTGWFVTLRGNNFPFQMG